MFAQVEFDLIEVLLIQCLCSAVSVSCSSSVFFGTLVSLLLPTFKVAVQVSVGLILRIVSVAHSQF